MMNERGVITVDYLFALVLVSGFAFIIFALSLTLTMVEVVQYMTFASARKYFAAADHPQDQQSAAYLKFQELKNSPVVRPLFNSGWFELDESRLIIASNISEQKSEFRAYDDAPNFNLFHGTVVWFTSKILEFNIPFYGSTVNDEMRGGNSFGANIGSYLGREVTHQECEEFLIGRWENFKLLSTGGNAPYSDARGADRNYVPLADNGC